MANPVKGEVSFVSGGIPYTYKFGTYAMAVLQKNTGMSAKKFFDSRGDDWGAHDLILVFQAALAGKHDLTLPQVGDIIDDIGIDRAVEIVKEGAGISAPQGGAGGTKGPRQGTKAKST